MILMKTSAKPDIKAEDEPHYHGHRDRLRERFLLGGPDALPDYELLELVLFMAIPRRDIKPLAKELIAKFGNLAGVLNASIEVTRQQREYTNGTLASLTEGQPISMALYS